MSDGLDDGVEREGGGSEKPCVCLIFFAGKLEFWEVVRETRFV